MSAQRPGAPGQSPYWLAGTPASMPAHAYVPYLADEFRLFNVPPEMFAPTQPVAEPPTFPIVPKDDGSGASLQRPAVLADFYR